MSDEQFSDDDDASWKVRRGAAKVLAAVYTNYSGDLDALYPKTIPSLLTRFREREENVRADIFVAFITLLQQVRPPSPPLPHRILDAP
jgi:cullin-associated NEDD8-dissociated protein 1